MAHSQTPADSPASQEHFGPFVAVHVGDSARFADQKRRTFFRKSGRTVFAPLLDIRQDGSTLETGLSGTSLANGGGAVQEAPTASARRCSPPPQSADRHLLCRDSQYTGIPLACSSKNRTSSAEASGPCESVYERLAFPPDQAWLA